MTYPALQPFVHKLKAMLDGHEPMEPTFHFVVADWLEERGEQERVVALRGMELHRTGLGGWKAVFNTLGGMRDILQASDARVHFLGCVLDLLAVTCPKCEGRPWNVRVRIADENLSPRGQANAPVETGIVTMRHKPMLGNTISITYTFESNSFTSVPGLGPLGQVIDEPTPCPECEGAGVVAITPPAAPDPHTPPQSVPRPRGA